MNPNSEFHIFRDVRRQLPASELVARLERDLRAISECAPLDDVLHLLLLAGELECALEDASAADDIAAASNLTSLFAGAAVRCDASSLPEDGRCLHQASRQLLQTINYAGAVNVGVAEGFGYYALHPLDFADLIARLQLDNARAVVIGIRTIGTTLSAVVAAKLVQLGIDVDRMTVRPTGHPYERVCQFTPQQRRAIACGSAGSAEFLICDEGPGRSGSSLLSVAEALEREGVDARRIRIVCSHEPDVSTLCAADAAARWRRYRVTATGMTRRLPAGAEEYGGGGEWRRALIAPDDKWPAVWPQMERLKYFSCGRRTMFTFEGHGPCGTAARARNEALSNSGFSVLYLGHHMGFGVHSLPPGRVARRSDLSPALLTHIAQYCAWRAKEFRVDDADSGELESVTRTNFAREFGAEFDELRLTIDRPAICDNRMAPHHWLVLAENRWVKLDAAIHGDDHFFPGPCDIAWDLAGVIIEWNLSSSARDFLLAEYRRASGDDAVQRISGYELAYAMFRLAWSRMAAASVVGSDEEARLLRYYRRYRRELERLRRDAVSPLRGSGSFTLIPGACALG